MSPSSTPSQGAQGDPESVPPHAPLPDYYGSESQRNRYVVDLFNKSAPHYNTIEKLFFNFGIWYRRNSLKRAGVKPGMRVLDVAMGTAAVARGAAQLVGNNGRVFGVDPSSGMIKQAQRVFHGPISRGIATELPFRDAQFDFVTMGIALRHVADLKLAFGEYFRVLKPGGTLWILEAHAPTSAFGQKLNRWMWANVIPGMTYLFTRSRDAKLLMDYYWDTIDQAASPETLMQTMSAVGFDRPSYRAFPPVCEYVARKPA